MDILISLLAIFGLSYAIRQTDGPYGVIAWARNQLMQNKYVGVFFYQLLQCPLCTGFWCGIAISLLQQDAPTLNKIALWGLSGAATSLILDAVLMRLWADKA
jgi:hypothetical protein